MAYLGFDPQVSSTSYRNIDDISASFDGFVTAFPLRVGGVVPGIAPINEQQVLINVGGVPQQPDPSGVNGFRLSAGNIVFSSAPSTGEKFWGVILAGVDRASAGVSYPDGSVTAPSITFDAQTTTGLYRSGSNQLAIALNGLNPVTFTTTGLRLNGATSGTVTLAAPAAAAGGNTLTLPTSNGSTYQILRNGATAGSLEFTDNIVSGTAVASTSGTSIDFTGIPSWVKRVTVMLQGVSVSGSSAVQLQIGSGSVVTSGYAGGRTVFGTSSASAANFSSGLVLDLSAGDANAALRHGVCTFTLLNGNAWIGNGQIQASSTLYGCVASTSITLSGTLDRVRITTVNGTDTFDAGSINILWE
jgi:hypothetical protein